LRAYERTVDGRKLEFLVKPNTAALIMVDAETGSEWDFTGKATGGQLSGRQLKKIAILEDYWFEWNFCGARMFPVSVCGRCASAGRSETMLQQH